jgi:FixJ family two-component response regulator/GGDEF domain-containing protein
MPKARVLAVDDQRYFRELIEGLLTDEGYEVQTASSGEEALHILEREDFEIVVTDLVMPGIDGSQLVERIKERIPDQEIVMVTGVVDVKTAVEAMKQGATDYILKPFDRKILTRSLEKILQRRRLRDEHARLMAENLEIMGVLSLYERVAGLFSTLSLEPLAERLIEGLCLETRAQGGVLWVVEDLESQRLRLISARGIIRVDEEPEELDVARLGDEFRAHMLEGGTLAQPLRRGGNEGEALYIPLRHSGSLIGIARLSDKLDADHFNDRDRAAAEKFVGFGSSAVVNALRFRSLERRSFRDPTTKAYTHAYFTDVVRNEIQKAGRFSHRFSLIRIEWRGMAELRRTRSETQFGQWLEALVQQLGSALRSTDLLATESESSYWVLLPETDALGGAVLKQRIREVVESGALMTGHEGEARPRLTLASATYPTDGTQLDGLSEVLERRLAENRESNLEGLSVGDHPFADLLEALLERAEPESPEMPAQITRFLLDDLARRPRDRGLLFISPGHGALPSLIDGIESLARHGTRTEMVVVSDCAEEVDGSVPITWVPPATLGTDRPFLLYYGDGPAYAMLTDHKQTAEGLGFFHTSDRVLVEHLVFQLQRDLGIPVNT